MSKRGYWYLATPYSKYAAGHEQAFRDAARECGRLMNAGIVVFSPIVHGHPLHVHGGMGGQTDFKSWEIIDCVMMDAAVGLIVCQLPGWNESTGVRAEINYFKQHLPDLLRCGIKVGEMPWWHEKPQVVATGKL